jgi:hypothetical protein
MRLGIDAEYFRAARCQASRESGRLKRVEAKPDKLEYFSPNPGTGD